ncbi:MAG: MarR family transcriptional regulator [Myxococcota bacterium]|nr:MarR family transcriptional regulator [Myxococcota bacterium]
MASVEGPHRTDLMWGLIRAFGWMDRCLQENLAARGWQPLSRTESSIMLFVDQGTTSPVDIARALGVSRQAINQATKSMIERGLLVLETDPSDGRRKVLGFPPSGEAIGRDAVEIIAGMERELAERLGKTRLEALRTTLAKSWGEVPEIQPSRTRRTTSRR